MSATASRSKKPALPSSLRLPHGDPCPSETFRTESPAANRRRRPANAPGISVQGERGAYSSLGWTTVGYRAARVAEREGRAPSRAGTVAHERVDRLRLQYQSRNFRRDNGIYQGIVHRARNYIIGTGFELDPMSKSSSWNEDVKEKWDEWWRDGLPEIRQERNGSSVERLVCDELLTNGELGVILTNVDDGKIQLVEAEQILGPEWLIQGIERDPTGKPTKYWVSPYDPQSGYILINQAVSYDPEVFLHVADFERISSNRAVPPMQSSFAQLFRINDTCDSEAIAWQVQARMAFTSTTEAGLSIPGATTTQNADAAPGTGGTSGDDSTQGYITELPYATIFHGKKGETLTGVERTAPGGTFTESLTMFLRLLGLPLGFPLELILLDWTHSNYSQSRAVLEQAYTSFLAWQELLVTRFYDRVYKWWLLGCIERGEIKARKDQFKHEWIAPTFPWIDQLHEAQAQGEKVDRGFTTYARVCKSLKTDAAKVRAQRANEVDQAIKIAHKIEDDNELPRGSVPWEMFCGMKASTKPVAVDADQTAEGAAPGEGSGGGNDEKDEKDKKPEPKTPSKRAGDKRAEKKKAAARARALKPRHVRRAAVTV